MGEFTEDSSFIMANDPVKEQKRKSIPLMIVAPMYLLKLFYALL